MSRLALPRGPRTDERRERLADLSSRNDTPEQRPPFTSACAIVRGEKGRPTHEAVDDA
jgi:hypothetical protein